MVTANESHCSKTGESSRPEPRRRRGMIGKMEEAMRGRMNHPGAIRSHQPRYARAERPSRGRSLAIVTALLLLISLLAPYATMQTSLAAPDSQDLATTSSEQQRSNTPPPLQGVFSVTVAGDVSQLIGNVALSPVGDGIWMGTAALGPGSYSYQLIVATNVGTISLGQDGLASPPANQASFTIPDQATGAVFTFNEATGAVNAGGTGFELFTDVGQFPMLPGPQGTYEIFFNSAPDVPITIQPIAFGELTGESAQTAAGDSGRIHVALNAAGQIQVAEAVQTATLDVFKTDQAGSPLGGACFTAYGGGDTVAGQACDVSDGSLDGTTRINFANGVPSGNVDIVESFTPDGDTVSDSQPFDLSSGNQQLQMVAQVPGVEAPPEEPTEEEPTGEETEEPTPIDEPTGGFTLTFFAVDLNGNALPGACFAIDGGEPVCDEDGDGSVIISNVQPGLRTLSEPQSPQGFEPYPDIQLEITRDEQFSVPHNPGVSAQIGQEEGATINIQSIDSNGNLLGGACYQFDNGASACDEDGDGVTTFANVAPGTYIATQTQTPQGFDPVQPFQFDVSGSGDIQVPHIASAVTPPEEPADEGFTVGFVSVDENQNGLPFACFSLDGGDPVCDEDGDGAVTFDNVAPGLHTLTQTQAPEGFDNVGTLDVNVDQDANFAVRHTPSAEPQEPEPTPTEEAALPGLTVGFVSVDENDNGLPGACFTLDGGDENCDDDGDAEVTFTGVQPGTHTLTQTRPPDGYQTVGTLELDLQNDGRFAVRHQPAEATEEPEEPTGDPGQIIVSTLDQDGNELPEVCYEVSGFGQLCDGDDEDRLMSQEDVPPGDYTVTLIVPEGFEAVGETTQNVTVGSGQAVQVQFQVQTATGEEPAPQGFGAISAIAVEEGFPILDACIAFDGPASGEVCDNQAGDADPTQGQVLIPDLPAGEYQVAMPNPPAGFDPAPAVAATVVDGEIAQVQLVVGGDAQAGGEESPSPDAGVLVILKTDVDGNSLPGACFQVGAASAVCDNGVGDTDGLEGVIRIEGIPPGDVGLNETAAPQGYLQAAGQIVTIQAGQETQLQVVNERIPLTVGSFRVIKREPDGSRLSGSCFALIASDGSMLGPFCDDAEGDIDDRNGVIEILDIPAGDYMVTETTVPPGYVGGVDVPMTVVPGERAEVTVMNEYATGSIMIAKVDEEGTPLGGACFQVGDQQICDNGDGDVSVEPGIIQVEGIRTGTVTVSETSAPEGFNLDGNSQTVDVVLGETATISFVNTQITGSLSINKLNENGAFLEGACFLIGDSEVCDNGDGDEDPDSGTILISGLSQGEVTVTESVAPSGYAIADDPQTVSIAGDDTVSIDFTNQVLTGSVVITKTDDSGNPLGGACFSIGGQEVCDNGAGDNNPDEGTVDVSGIPVGEVEISETAAPQGYAGSADPQTVTVGDGEAATAAFTNVRQTGTLRIEKTNEAGELLGGACFDVAGVEICDNGDGDQNGDAGVIEITGIGSGPVDVTETAAPDGYVITGTQTVDVAADDVTTVQIVNLRQTGAVEITTASASGSLLGGACYTIAGQEVCDNEDGDEDGDSGIIAVTGIPTGEVTVAQSLAPEGFAGGVEAQTVAVEADETSTASFVNGALSGTVRIEKVDENGNPVGGSCFVVGAQRVCDDDDSDQNSDPGFIELGGQPIGPVSITETVVPDGYFSDGASQSVSIVAGQTVIAVFVNPRLTGTIRIESVDESGAPLGGACFQIGDQSVCDDGEGDANGEAGVVEAVAPIGSVTVAGASAPEGYAPDSQGQTVDVTTGETTTVTMVNTRLVGGVRIEKSDQNGEPLAGACFSIGGTEVCDNAEGDANGDDGIVEITGIPTGSVDIVETVAPEGYVTAGGQTVQISAGEVVTVPFTNIRLVGTVLIQKTDENGDPLAGSCFSVGGVEVCDNGEGDLNPDDGVIEVGSVPTGTVEVTETVAPDGFTLAASVQVIVESNQTAEVPVSNVRAVGTVTITKTDQDGNPLEGACFTIGGGDPVCDNGDGDENPDTGAITVSNVPAGPAEVVESTVPAGYAGSDAQTIEVPVGETASATFVNTRILSSVSITKTDGDGNPLPGACFTVGGLAEVCDDGDGDLNGDSGVIEIENVPVGSVTVVESTTPNGYVPAGDQTIDVVEGETAAVTFVNERSTGSLVITKTDAEGEALAGACFTVGGQEVCDDAEGDANGEPGIVQIDDIATGSIEVAETTVPDGYNGAAPQTVEIAGGEQATLTFVNQRSTGSLVITKTDADGEALAGACFTVGGQEVCDDAEGDANGEPGIVQIDDIPTGSVDVAETTVPDGYNGGAPQTVEIAGGEQATLTFVNERNTGSLVITKTDADGEALAGACFTVGGQEVCDDGEGDANGEPGVIQIDDIPTGAVEVAESSAPDGYDIAAPQTADIRGGEQAELTFADQRSTGTIVINKNGEDGESLGGACFAIGEIAVCDNGDGDANDADGVIEIAGIPTGTVDIVETTAPEGYATAAPQSVDVRSGESATVTIANTLLAGSVQILKTDEAGEPLAGSCFLVDGREICDNGDSDESDVEGTILVSEIAIGPIVVSETEAPEGYSLAAEAKTVEIAADAVVDVTFVNAVAVGIVSISKTDEEGEPLAGACFTVGESEVCDNQDGDANPADGTIDVENVPVGTVEIAETVAPANYDAAAEPQSVEVREGETATATFVNILSVGGIAISKTDPEGNPLGGACFTLDESQTVCDNGDGDANPDEGEIEIVNVPVGEHALQETQSPEGYVGSPEVLTVDVTRGETATLAIENQLAVGAISIRTTSDDTGELLGGACFAINDGAPVCDNAEGDQDDTAGVVVVTVPVGEHTVTETQAPEGYDGVLEPVTVTVGFAEAVEVPFVNTRFTGTLRIAKTDNTTGESLAGACFSLEGETSYGPVCDNGDGDADPAEGIIAIQGIEPDVYAVTETTTPDGFEEPGGPVAENLIISGGAIVDLDVPNEPEGAGTRPILPPTGQLVINKVDDGGNALAGACFSLSGAAEVGPVCDNDAADLDPANGVISIGEIPTGDYLLSETTAPAGYTGTAPVSVQITLDETATVEVVNTAELAEPGSLRIQTRDADGNPIGGACFTVGTVSRCDNAAGDTDPAAGEIVVSGLLAGDYLVTNTEPPAGFVTAEPQTTTVDAGAEATVSFSFELAPEETGGLEFQLRDSDGNAVPDACVTLSEVSNDSADLVFCDGGEEDVNDEPGVLTVENLPVGTFSVRQLPASDEGTGGEDESVAAAGAMQILPEKTVQVKPGQTIVVVIIIVIEPPQAGGIDIVKRSQDTNILQGGACFQVTGQGNDVEICDNDGVDTNLTVGVVRFTNLMQGLYTITETKSPPGYDPGGDSEVAVFGGAITTVTFRNPPTPDPIGDLTILKVDPEGDPVAGTCFELRSGNDVIAGPVCDEDDGQNDGIITFTDVEPGDYILRETQAASNDYQPIPDQPVTIVAGQNVQLPVVNTLKPGSILIVKYDDEGNGPIGGACFGLDRGNGIEFEVCDQQAGDGDLEEGVILIGSVPPGDYDLVETAAPAGFDPGPAIPVTVSPGTQLQLDVENTPATPPTETGDLTIIKRNSKGEPLPGACFALRQGAVIRVPQRCDGDDGNLDGRISFTGVGVGQYGVIETKKPSADYQTPPEKFVTITKDAQLEIVIVNILKPGHIQISKVNQQGQPLANACFKVTPGFFAAKCTDGSGIVVFDNLPPGVYTVTETQAPYGYLTAPPVT
ncbi:MAG: hypothetical protein KF883_16935, partial [Thermomicrobiales bacterium]|nr:hypothetical protein [Thermomicrobiales bacterium]